MIAMGLNPIPVVYYASRITIGRQACNDNENITIWWDEGQALQ
jgi:hypothetical protein